MESENVPIINALKEVPTYIRWCTPSVLPDQEKVPSIYKSDISVSAHFLGSYVDNTEYLKRHTKGPQRCMGQIKHFSV